MLPLLPLFLAPGPDMGLIAMLLGDLPAFRVVVAFVRT